METIFTVKDGVLFLNVKVVPGASKTEITGIKEGNLKIRVAAQPERNKANEELRAFLAKTLSLAKKDVAIVKGTTSRLKVVTLPASREAALIALLS